MSRWSGNSSGVRNRDALEQAAAGDFWAPASTQVLHYGLPRNQLPKLPHHYITKYVIAYAFLRMGARMPSGGYLRTVGTRVCGSRGRRESRAVIGASGSMSMDNVERVRSFFEETYCANDYRRLQS